MKMPEQPQSLGTPKLYHGSLVSLTFSLPYFKTRSLVLIMQKLKAQARTEVSH